MRVMVIVKATEGSEAGGMPSEDLLAAMSSYNEELASAGVLLSGEGLQPSARGKRIAMSSAERTASDGPFPATSELVAGFWIWKVSSMDEAVAWARRCPDPMPGEATHLEIRPLAELEDFGDKMTPELRQREEWLRAAADNRAGASQLRAPALRDEPKIRTCLWFDGNGEEAANHYVSLLPGSTIQSVSRPEPGKPALVVELSLAGAPYMFLNGGPRYKQTPAASIAVRTADQVETDRLWNALLAGGGEESMCGWLMDRFGVSWQIVPAALPSMLGADDREAAGRALQAMLRMKKIDIAALEAAFRAG